MKIELEEYFFGVYVYTKLIAGDSRNVYNINANAFGRVAAAAASVGHRISMTSPKDEASLTRLGIDTSVIDKTYYPDWSDYLAALEDHQMLLLSLDWPDESPIHRDELATIFPTKTPEWCRPPYRIQCKVGIYF